MSCIKHALALVFAVLVTTAVVVSADTPAKGRLPTGWKALGLTDQQKEQVYDIQGRYAAQTGDLQRQGKQLRQKEKADLEAVLTLSQKARLRDIALEGAPREEAPNK